MKRIFLCGLAILLLTGCAQLQPKENKLAVAVTILPQKAFLEAVCGGEVEVVVMVPPGASPESYEPTPQQMEEFSRAAVYFTIGVPAEETIRASADQVEVVELDREVRKVYDDLTFEDGGRDQHIWLSPKRVAVMVTAIAEKMRALDPENAGTYLKNAEAFKDQLSELDTELSEIFAGMENKRFMAVHPAFGYFADYGLTMYALEQHGKEATPRHLTKMLGIALSQGLKDIFTQAEDGGTEAQAFAEETGGRVVVLNPLSEDYIENMRSMAKAIAGDKK